MAEEQTQGQEAVGAESQRLFSEIETSGALPEGVDARSAVGGVLCTLALRLTAGEARDFIASLPDDVRPLLRACTPHRAPKHDEAGQLFGKEEFVRKVAHHFKIDEEEAEPLARAVLRATRTRISEGELHGVEGQLPKELKELWTHG